jgi:quinoprotein dehydrogenase-associated probable ABC transporter substrate-binding protein
MVITSGCSTPDQTVSAEPKHYLSPPKQKKIPVSTSALRVCADPNNLPFSNKKGEGFENKIAELIAQKLKLPIEYTWFAQRRGFFRNTLREGKCDVVIGAPEKFERADSTSPYYYSSYVFVSRRDRGLNITRLDDPLLKNLKVGVQIIGDDANNTPPAHTLAEHGVISNVVGYTVYGNYTEPNPPSRIVDAVANGDVDIAVVWGPLAGYFAAKQKVPLDIRPVIPEPDAKRPYAFGISVAVRYGEDEFKQKLDDLLADNRSAIQKILDNYHVPRVPEPEQKFELEGGDQ